MPIVWKGYGLIVLLITVAALMLTQAVANQIGGNDYFSNNHWLAFLSLCVSGVILWFIGAVLHDKTETFIDTSTGEVHCISPDHSFYYLKVEYWGFILPLIGVVYMLY